MNTGFYKSITLEYFGLIVRFSSRRISDIQWLEEFLCPAFVVQKSGSPRVRVRLDIDEETWDGFSRRFSNRGNPSVPGFLLDTKLVELDICRKSEREIVLFDSEFRVFYLVSALRQDVTILAHPKWSVGCRTAAARVLIEFSMNHARSRGGIFLHASALASGKKGIIIAGPKNSGKTSLLLGILLSGSGEFISNDRVLVHSHFGPWSIQGMPTVITIAEKSLAIYTRLKSDLLFTHFHHRYTIDEIYKRGCIPYFLEKGEYTVSLAQFCRLLVCSAAQVSNLFAILFPSIHPGTVSLEVKKLDEGSAMKKLEESRLGIGIKGTQSFFNIPFAEGFTPERRLSFDQFSRSITQKIPCYICRLPYGKFSPDEYSGMMRAIRDEL